MICKHFSEFELTIQFHLICESFDVALKVKKKLELRFKHVRFILHSKCANYKKCEIILMWFCNRFYYFSLCSMNPCCWRSSKTPRIRSRNIGFCNGEQRSDTVISEVATSSKSNGTRSLIVNIGSSMQAIGNEKIPKRRSWSSSALNGNSFSGSEPILKVDNFE